MMKHEANNPYQSSFGSIVQINFRLLFAFTFVVAAWFMWPETALGYGWGFLSICLCVSAFGLFIETVKAIVKLFVRDRALKKYMAQGNKPKSAELASDDALKNSEMIDD